MNRILRVFLLLLSLLAVAFLTAQITIDKDVLLAKLSGRGSECPWSQIAVFPLSAHSRTQVAREVVRSLQVDGYEAALGIEHVRSPKRAYWIKRAGHAAGGVGLLASLISDHRYTAQEAGQRTVRPGDTVLDCGAHVGVFVNQALELGARKVVAIEPDPVNLECLRRNFASEIQEGRVVVCPIGVWSSETTLSFQESEENSGMDSAVLKRDGRVIQIPVTTIDALVGKLGLSRIDFIKMDIEGAEREALKGAAQTLKKQRPRLMLDSYHRPDDMPVFRRLLADFQYTTIGCERCDQDHRLLVPHATFWQAGR